MNKKGNKKGVRTVFRLLLAVSLFASAAGPLAAQSSDTEFLEGLRQRGLYRLAASYCEKALTDSSLPVSRRADLVVQLSQTFAEHARQTPPAKADPLWQRAVEEPGEFARAYPNSGWGLAVSVQGDIVLVARGELLWQRAAVTGNPQKLLAEARGYLRTAVRNLRTHDDQLVEQLRRPRRPLAGEDEPSRAELLSLQKNLRYQLARAYRNQGQCYPDESPDRDNALRQALELLDVLALMQTVDPLAWQSRLDEIVCLRLIKDYPAAARRLASLEKEGPPPAVQLRARAERVRLLLALGRVADAVRALGAGREVAGQTSADLDFAHLETCLAAWAAAVKVDDQERAAEWQRQATEVVRDIERLHAPFWAFRAEALLASKIAGAGLTGDLAILVRAAQGHYRAGQIDDAVAAYDRAAEAATKQRLAEQAFQLSYTAASIEHARKNYAVARQRFRDLALSQAENPQAGDAHLLAIFNAAQLARQTQPVQLEDYTALILEHLQRWPQSDSANHARWYLGRLREHQGRWEEALAAYRQIGAHHDRYYAGLQSTVRCYDGWLGELRAGGRSLKEVARQAANYFELILLGREQRWPERWSPAARLAALQAARMRLSYLGEEFARAERFLTAALSGAPAPPATFVAAANSLLVVALSGQGRYEEAAQVMQNTAAAGPAALLDMLEGLGAIIRTASPEAARGAGQIQLQGTHLLAEHRAALDVTGRKRLDVITARATAATGQLQTAVELFQRLADQHPRDGDIQEALAELLLEAGDRRSLQAALGRWQDLERKSKTGTPRWFRAKYYLAETHERLGNPAQAAKIIEVTQVLHPELGGPELKAQFLALLKRCRAK